MGFSSLDTGIGLSLWLESRPDIIFGPLKVKMPSAESEQLIEDWSRLEGRR